MAEGFQVAPVPLYPRYGNEKSATMNRKTKIGNILASKTCGQANITDHCLDIRITHDSVELRMMELFQEVDSKNFDSSIFLLITGEVSCSKFQPTVLTDFLSSKHMNSSFCLRRFYDWLHWRVDNVDISRITNHLAAWLHWSFEYID